MNSRNIFLTFVCLMTALPAFAGPDAPALQQSDNVIVRIAVIVLGVVMIWLLLYKAAYPFFLRYYRDDFCKTIFWNLFLLYTLTWVLVSFYTVLDIGFYWAWLPWLAAFLGAWWLISGLILILRRVPA